MPRRIRHETVDELLIRIDTLLAALRVSRAKWTLRTKVLKLVEIGYGTRCLNVAAIHEHDSTYSLSAAKDRLRRYLREHVGKTIDSTELDVVSGISDFPRRIRELRTEEGYRILTGTTRDPEFSDLTLKPDQYLLASIEPDDGNARRWLVANRHRKSPFAVRQRLLNFLLEYVGQVVTTEELAYVASGKKEWARRVRELRTEEGYAIATRLTGRTDLGQGEYILLSADRVAEPHDRHIPLDVQREVYERDGNACRACGWTIERHAGNDRRILELHHLLEHANRGENTPINLIVLCSRCHDQVHAGTLKIAHLKNE
jgi:hypothetical protein